MTADSAFLFEVVASDVGLLERAWPEARGGVIGIAPMDFYLWPVVVRPWGPKERCYRWPYYFSNSPERRSARDALSAGFARFVDYMVGTHGRRVALVCMEELDEPLAQKIRSLAANPEMVRVFSSRQYNASQMTAILRGLELLVTSRYHAGVLSLAAHVPQIAVGHDERLADLYRDLQLYEDYFIRFDQSGLFDLLRERTAELLNNPGQQIDALVRGYDRSLRDAGRSRSLLAEWASRHYAQRGMRF